MTYDEAIQKLDTIIATMETDEALSMEEYKAKAKEAKALIAFCHNQLTTIEQDLQSLLPPTEA